MYWKILCPRAVLPVCGLVQVSKLFVNGLPRDKGLVPEGKSIYCFPYQKKSFDIKRKNLS